MRGCANSCSTGSAWSSPRRPSISACMKAGGRLPPVVEKQITATIRNIDLLHADETSWKRHGQLLWLWVFTCAHATLFVVGKRSVEVVREVLGTAFTGWLMSDGFWAYRELDQRLRCLAHLIRKAHGLEESLEHEAQRFGAHLLEVLETVIAAVYEVRSGAPPLSVPDHGCLQPQDRRLGGLPAGVRRARRRRPAQGIPAKACTRAAWSCTRTTARR
ncbi:MAG: hypothetical protein EOM91_23765 [Sphingobacteriia bacterium]|nr:hypothetical protein [Sphingobacteriia bacterium]